MTSDLGLKALVLSPLIIIVAVMFIVSFYLGYKQSQKTNTFQAIIKGVIATLILTGLTYLSSGSTFGSQKTFYTAIIFVLFAGGYFLGVLIEDIRKKS